MWVRILPGALMAPLKIVQTIMDWSDINLNIKLNHVEEILRALLFTTHYHHMITVKERGVGVSTVMAVLPLYYAVERGRKVIVVTPTYHMQQEYVKRLRYASIDIAYSRWDKLIHIGNLQNLDMVLTGKLFWAGFFDDCHIPTHATTCISQSLSVIR